MKKITALLLALLMIASFAACSGSGDKTTEPDTTVEDTTVEETTGGITAEGMDYFTINMSADGEKYHSLLAYTNENGTVSVDYVGDIRKKADLDASVMATIEEALSNSGLAALNGQEVYEEGAASGSVYITFTDGTTIAASFSGVLPEAFTTAYSVMETCFQTITADVAEYVPQPQVLGELAESDKTALDGILSGMNLQNADSYVISGVEKGEFFAYSLGLSSDEGIASGLTFGSMMMTSNYSLSIVTVEEGTSAEDAADNLNSGIDWRKFVCTSPEKALVATKGNQALCLMGSGSLYDQTLAAIQDAGWTTVYSLTNPDL